MLRTLPRRLLGLLLLVLLAGLLLGIGLLGTDYGQRYLTRQVRTELARRSDLVVSPFQLRLTWQDFPHLTASVRHLTLTDTAYQRRVPVLVVQRADLRLGLGSLLRGRLRVAALHVHGAELRDYVDARGRHWALRGRRPGPGAASPPEFELPTVRLHDVRLLLRNDYKRSRFAAQIARAELQARLRGGLLTLAGPLTGVLDSLQRSTGTLLAAEPVQGRVQYRYAFGPRRGRFLPGTRFTLRGDTIRLSGTHTAAGGKAGGAGLRLRFEGRQRLLDVLPAVLPSALRPYLAGARSPSRAHLRFTLRGLSTPTAQPRAVLRLELRQAQLRWADHSRRISRWDLVAVFDNGPAHHLRTTSLTLRRCRIYSPLGRLDVRLQVRDFTRPTLLAHVRGRTDLPGLAALLAPDAWRAGRGGAELDVRLRGPLPTSGAGQRAALSAPLAHFSVRGHVALHDADLVVLGRNAHLTGLNVRLGLQDSLWQLDNFSGWVDGMRFRAQARTLYLLDYLLGRRASTLVSGQFTVQDLRVARLGQLLRPARPVGASRPRAAADSSLLPPGLRLRVALRCARLLLPTDTLQGVRVLVRRDGYRTSLSGLTARVWGGEVSGRASWPGPLARRRGSGNFRLAMRFDTVDYRRAARLISRTIRARPGTAGGPAAGPRPAGPRPLRRLLLTANGQLSCSVGTLLMPVGENLRHVRLRAIKAGSAFQLPALYFATTSGGAGFGQATARLAGSRLQAATASLDLRYATVDVQRLLLLLASLQPDDEEDAAPAGTARPPGRPAKGRASTLLAGQLLTARLHVRAEHVRYGALSGTGFRLTSRLRPGEARVDDCSLQAFGGQLHLRGRLLTNAGQGHHPLHVQAQLRDVQLPRLFELAQALRFEVLGPANVRGRMSCEADLHTDLDATFLPATARTQAYARADVQDLELLNVAPLQQALRLLGQRRTSHLYFRPVSTSFFLDQTRLLVPELRLASTLTDLEISGDYDLSGRANLYLGVNPVQALLGNTRRRSARIQADAPTRRSAGRHLLYVNLRRPQGHMRYSVRPFQRREKQLQQARLRQECRQLLLRQPIDTTLRLLRPPVR